MRQLAECEEVFGDIMMEIRPKLPNVNTVGIASKIITDLIFC